MGPVDELPEKLIYAQTWKDIRNVILIIAVIIGIFIITSESIDSRIAFILVFVFISSLILIIFAFFAIRRFELHPDKIILEYLLGR